VKKVNKKWASSLLLCTFLLYAGSSPAMAALNQANFIPCNASTKQIAGKPVQSYYVRPGDNLWNISRTYQVDLKTLMSINKLDQNSILRVGQKLQIPGKQARVHIISRGETLWDISRHYNVDLAELQRLNSNKQANNLKIGDQIYLPGDTARIAFSESLKPSRSIVSRFTWPIRGTITSKYGWRDSGFHHGLDIAGNLGDPVQAAAGGVVSCTGYISLYGNTVIIDHSDGKQTLYAHLSQIKVKPGDRVARGSIIATVGSTGRSTGPHLHFEIKQGDTRDDPLAYLR
jgi:murein DD-endopeptidase MepM/ murein hydrolase activator NlpD